MEVKISFMMIAKFERQLRKSMRMSERNVVFPRKKLLNLIKTFMSAIILMRIITRAKIVAKSHHRLRPTTSISN